jgi:RNA polymerase sigma factor for flagellar operon FliA
MLDELRRLDAMPRRARRSARKVAQALRVVEQKEGRPAAEEEVAAEMGLNLESYQALRTKLDASRIPMSLGGGGTSEDDEAPVREVADTKVEQPDELAARSQVQAQVVRGMESLSERMQTVLAGLYMEGKTLKQIGATLGVSESRVCQIHTEALKSLRTRLADADESSDAALLSREPPASETRLRAAIAPSATAANAATKGTAPMGRTRRA